MKNAIINFYDDFKNVIKGLGTSKDPRKQTTYVQGIPMNQELANSLYVYNWLAAKVVNIPVEDATRKWRSLLVQDPEKKLELEQMMKEFDVRSKLSTAAKWSRVFGGSVIIAIIEGQDLEEPLDVETIRPDSLKNFLVLDRYNIYPLETNRNIMDKNFGQPEFYSVSRSGQAVHHSRLYKMIGTRPTIREAEQQNFWGLSIFTKGYDPIQDSQTVSQAISSLIFDANVDVYRIKDLHTLVADGKDDLVVRRLKIAHEMKGYINGIALDKEDEYDKKNNTFTDLPAIDDRFIQKVSGAFDIPVTRLLGTSPAGMNSTGESDMLNYYDNVQSSQENELRPALEWMDSIILANAGYKDDFQFIFNPLKQLTELEQAQFDLNNAQRDQIYLDPGVIQPTDVQAELAENGTYVTINAERVQEELEAQGALAFE